MENFNYVDLNANMYKSSSETFSELISKKDSNEDYICSIYKGTDAFERQLIRFGIRAGDGKLYAGTLSDFFQNRSTSLLLPEFIRRCVQKGMDRNPVLKTVAATYNLLYDEKPFIAPGGDPATLNRHSQILHMDLSKLKNLRINIFSNILEETGEKLADRLVRAMVNFLKSYDNYIDVSIHDYTIFAPGCYCVSTMSCCYVLNSKALHSVDISSRIEWLTNCLGKFGENYIVISECADDDVILLFDRHHQFGVVNSKEIIIENVDKIIDGDLRTAKIENVCGFYNIVGAPFRIHI